MGDVNGLSIERDVLDELGQVALDASTTRLTLDDPAEYSFTDVLDDITAKATAHGLERIGDGSNRVVFADPATSGVVKFPLENEFRSGLEQNRVEAYLWDALEESCAPWSPAIERFFQVLESDPANRWIVMEQAALTEDDEEFDTEDACIAMVETFPFLEQDAEFCLTENIGWNHETDGYALFDYGSFIPRQFIEIVLGVEHIEPIGEDNIA